MHFSWTFLRTYRNSSSVRRRTVSWKRVIRKERRTRIGGGFSVGEEVVVAGVSSSLEEVSEVAMIRGLAMLAGSLAIFQLIVSQR
jgi:hypothetical protein